MRIAARKVAGLRLLAVVFTVTASFSDASSQFTDSILFDFTASGSSSCKICASSYECNSGSGWTLKYVDSISPGMQVIGVDVVTYYTGCATSMVSYTLNDSAIGSFNYTSSCNCSDCFVDTVSRSVTGMFPNYQLGDTNVLKVSTGSSICVAKIVVLVHYVSTGYNDAAVKSLDSLGLFCSGNTKFYARIANFGKNQIDSVKVNWEFNDTLQTPVVVHHTLDTLGGSGSYDTLIYLGVKYLNNPSGDSIKVWTSNPNGVTDTLNSNDTLRRTLVPSMSGVYTIGGSSPDYATIAAALTDLKARSICGPVVFKIRTGTYSAQVTIDGITGTSSINTITFESETGDSTDVKLTYFANSSSENWVIRFNGAKHVRFRKLTIEPTGTSYATGVLLINRPENIEVSNCILDGPYSSSGSNRSLMYSNDNYGIENLILRNNVFRDGGYALYLEGGYYSTSGINHLTIEDNKFIDSYNGIYIYSGNELQINGNILYNSFTYSYGIYFDYCFDIQLIGNEFEFDYGGAAIELYDCVGSASNRSVIANNFITIKGTNGGYALETRYTDYLDVVFNSINNISGNNAYGYYGYYNDHLRFINNNLVSDGYVYYLYSNSNEIIDHNNLYSPYIIFASDGNLNYTDLQSWTTGTGYDSNSINLDPQYMAVNNLRTKQIDLNGTGMPYSLIQTDIDGDQRDTLAPDIGADEFEPNTLDAQLVDFSPISLVDPDLKVLLKNNGGDTITSVKIGWKVGTVMKSVVNWSGSVPSATTQWIVLDSLPFSYDSLYQVTAWSFDPNAKTDSFPGNDTISKQVAYALAGTYTIGGASPDFESFTAALNAMKIGGIADTVVFNVRDSTYIEQLEFPRINGTEMGYTITFKSQSGDSSKVILSYSSSYSQNYIVSFNGTSNIRFHQVSFISLGTSYTRLIYFQNGSRNISITNCYLQGYNTTSTSTNYNLVLKENNGKTEDIQFMNNYFYRGSSAVNYYSGSSGVDQRTSFENNIFSDQYYRAVYIQSQDQLVFSGNDIHSNTSYYAGLYGIYGNNLDYNFRIEKNKIYGNIGRGIYLYSSDVGSTDTGIVANNFVTATVAGYAEGIGVYSSQYIQVLFNNVLVTSNNITDEALHLEYNSYLDISNNNFINYGSGYAVYVYNSSTQWSYCDHNNYFSNGNYMGYFSGARDSLANWQLATGADSFGLEVDPNYLSNTDLHVENVVLNKAAISIPYILDDIDGELRDTTPDIGADEFSPPANDAELTRFTVPGAILSADTNMVSVTLRNSGLDSLKSASLYWVVNGDTQSVVNWTGILATGDSVAVQLGNYVFNDSTQYNLTAWSKSPNGQSDDKFSNDTVYDFNRYTSLSGVYTIGGSSPDFSSFNQAVGAMVQRGVIDSVYFNVRNGNYYEHIRIPEVNGIQHKGQVVFQSESGDSTDVSLIYSAIVQDSNYVILLDGVYGMLFRKMTIQSNSVTTYANVIVFRNQAYGNSFINNQIIGINISSSSNNYTLVLNNLAGGSDNEFRGNYLMNGSYGFYFYTSSLDYDENLVIENNTFYNTYYHSINLEQSLHPVVRGNRILFTNGSNVSAYGIYMESCHDSIRVERNLIQHPNQGNGMYFYYCGRNYQDTGYVMNNMIVMPSVTSTRYGLNLYGSQMLMLAHNTVRIGGNSTGSSPVYGRYGDRNILLNNILVNDAGGYVYNLSSTGTFDEIDNNDLSTNGPIFANLNGTTYATLKKWQDLTNYDTVSLSVDPYFSSNTDLHIRNIDLNGAAWKLSFVTEDFDGDIRLASTDIGADEFTPSQLDAGVFSVLNPTVPFLADTVPVVVAVKNHGTQTITAVKIIWEINQSRDSMVWNDSIYSGDTTHVVLQNFYFHPDSVYSIRAWTSIPNGVADTANYNDTATVEDVKPALRGIYTIGGSFPDFETFNDAVNAMIIGGIIDSVRFDVRNGTYRERFTIPEIRGVTGANSIIFQSENRDSSLVILQDSALNWNENYVIHLDGAHGVTFRFMTLKSAGYYYGKIVQIDNESHSILFTNNDFIGSSYSSTSNDISLIYSENSIDTALVFTKNRFRYGSIAINLNGMNSSNRETSNVIAENILQNQYYTGVYLIFQSGIVVSGNTIVSSGAYYAYYGIYTYYTYPVQIVQNKIDAGIGYYAIYNNRSYNSSGDRGLIANNFLSKQGAQSTAAMYIYQSEYMDVVYNTIHDQSTSTSSNALQVYYGLDVHCVNNIFSSANGYAINKYGSGLNVSDYNDLYTGGSYLGYYNGNHSDLGTWQSNTNLDSHSISVDPAFTSSTDLHVVNTDINAAALPFPGIAVDIDNESRDTLTPDIGADEFSLPAADDAGISRFIGPASPFVSGNRTVQLEIKNHGSDTLKSATVHWVVNGSTQSSYSWSGNVPSGKTDTFNIGTFNFQAGVIYTLEAWTTSPNGQTDSIPWNDTLIHTGIMAGLDGIYTIGGVAPDFATFNNAIDALLTGGVVDTVEFHVRAGTYTEKFEVTAIPGAGISKPVTITSEDMDSTKVVLQYNNTTNENFIIQLDGVSYLTIKNITVQSLNTSYGQCLILSNGTHHVSIQNNIITAKNTNSGLSRLIYSGSTIDNFITIKNNRFVNGSTGVDLTGASSQASDREVGNVIMNNHFSGQGSIAILVSNQKGLFVKGNVIRVQSNYYSFTGIQISNADDTTRIEGNDILDQGTNGTFTGIYLNDVERAGSNYPLVANNFIASSQSYAYGIRIHYSSEVKIFYNSIHLYGINTGNAFGIYMNQNLGLQLMNNILSNYAGGYVIFMANSTMNLALSDYNDLYTTGAVLVRFYSTNYSTLSSWRSGVSRDINSISTDPNFVSNTNLHAYISSLDGKAYPLNEVQVDIDGAPRDSLTPDIGADEFNSLPNNIGITGIIQPVNGCELDSVVVSVDVFNFGSLPQTGFDVVYRLDNGSPVTQNFGTSDTLFPGNAKTFNFNQKQKVTTGLTYDIKIYTDLSGDQDRSGDTALKTFTNYSTPDTVKNMVPVDSAINQDFPLALSWSPVSGATKYDVYVWENGTTKPGTPLRTGLVSISTSISQYELVLLYGKSYKWQVKAYNDYCSVWSPINLFTMKELPDLTVSSVSVPASAFSSTSITVSWIVKNDVTGVTGSTPWYDYIYLSSDSILDGTDRYLGYELNKTALGPGQSYSSSKSVNIPDGINGNWYIIVSTDVYHYINEKNDNNNTKGKFLPVTLTPPPDLVVTSIIKPLQVYSGTSIAVQWTITNDGDGGANSPTWYDQVYLSTDSSEVSAIYLGYVKHSGTLAKDSSYTSSLNTNIPVNISGNYYVVIKTDVYNQVYEHANEANNSRASDTVKVILAPPPDFIATGLGAPDSASNRTWVNVSYAVENLGVGDNYTKYWYDKIFLSHKNTFNQDSSMLLYTVYRSGTISGFGSNRYNQNVLIPSNIHGQYYIYVQTDAYNTIFEYDKENNNISSGFPVIIVSPDMIVRNIQLPATDSSGTSLTFQYTVVNNGYGDMVSNLMNDSIYISANSQLYAGAYGLTKSSYYATIAAGDSVQRTVNVTIPNGTSGTRYIHVVTDRPNRVYEAGLDMNNNSAASLNVVLTPWPDLVIDSLYITQDSLASGDTIMLHFTVRNDGIGSAATGHTNQVYLSKDTAFGVNDTRVGEYKYLDTLGVDSVYSVVLPVIIPKNTVVGDYHIILVLDTKDELYEHQHELNNTGSIDAFYIKGYPPVDLVAGCLNGPDTVLSGSSYNYTWQVTNSGEAETPVSYWKDAIYLSLDTLIDVGDQLLNSVQINEVLQKDSSYLSELTVKIPDGLQGNYYLILSVDNLDRNNDVNKGNNLRVLCDGAGDPVSIRINLAPTSDLEVISMNSPANVTAGQPFKIQYSIRNNGISATKSHSWTDRVYLSTDFNISGQDYILGSKTHFGLLDTNGTYYDSMNVTAPVQFSGNYVLILKTDANDVEYEYNGENNNTDAGAVLITQAPPADLVVTDVTATDSAVSGESIPISWTIRNIGSNPASGTMRDHIYLSTDTVWDVSDVLIAHRDRQINIVPNATSSQNINALISGVSSGQYYIIVRTDIKNNINESNDDNNEENSSPMKVNVQLLPLNVWTSDTIVNGMDMGYRIEISSQLQDESMLVELKADSVNGNNEIFLRYGQMATGAENDFSYSDPFSGNQHIVVSELNTGTYYLLLRGTSPVGSQMALIRPRILDFEIREVHSGEGGNTGQVTLRIEGSKFDSTTVFHLTGYGDTITSVSTYFKDRTLMYATFNLKGARLGKYSMIAEQINGDLAKKTDCFTVVPGMPADVQIHVRKPSGVRTNRVVTMYVEFTNAGNTDITNKQLILNSPIGAPVSFDLEGLEDDANALMILMEEGDGPPGVLRAGGSSAVVIYTFTSSALGFNIIVPNLDE